MEETGTTSSPGEAVSGSGNIEIGQCLEVQVNKVMQQQQQQKQGHHNIDQHPHKTTALSNGCSSNSPTAAASSVSDNQQHSAENKGANTAASPEAAETQNQISGFAEHQEDQQSVGDGGIGDEQLSPNSSLRRSSRVSALKAKQKLQQHSTQQPQGPTTSLTDHPAASTVAATATIPPVQPPSQEPKQQQQQQQQLSVALSPKEELQPNPKTKLAGAVEMVQELAENQEMLLSDIPLPHEESAQHQQRVSSLKRKLKRKLEDGQSLDQYDCKFGIRIDTQGDVVMMSDGSEISSLDDLDVADLKERYEFAQKQEVSDEVRAQRQLQIRELETSLRLEEAKLLMMKKLRQSQQQQAIQKQQQEGIRRLAPGVVQNSSGQAYKPKVAVVNPQGSHQQHNAVSSNANAAMKMNGTSTHGATKKGASGTKSTGNSDSAGMQNLVGAASAAGGIQLSTLPPQHLQVIQQLYERLSQNPQQMANLIKTLPPQTGQALTELLRQYAMAQTNATGMGNYGQQQAQQTHQGAQVTKSAQQQQSAGPISHTPTQAQIDAANKQARELTQQNITKARQQMRREFDLLITKLPVPKAPPPDLLFIPNGNQPEFAYLLGLDLTVQRVLKDRQMFRKPNFPPYRCEECETDFTPSWKAICGENEDCHLYCEKCVRQAQKRKVCQDYKQLLQRAFQQIKEREKDFERQVVAGKYNVEPVLPTPPPAPPIPNAPSSEKLSKVLQQQNNTSVLSQPGLKGQAAAALQQLNQQQNASAALNLSKSVSTGGAGPTATANAMVNAAIKNASSGAQSKTPSNAAASKQRTAASTANATANAAASVANNPLASLVQQNPLYQQQFAMAALTNSPVLRQLGQLASNPMMLAAISQNPMLLQQLFTMAAQQHQRSQQQQQQQSTAAAATTSTPTAASTVPAGAAAALAQLAQKSSQAQKQQQQQQQTHHHRSSTSSHQAVSNASVNTPNNVNSNAGSSSANQQATQMQAALSALMGSAAANPLLAFQSQLGQLNTQNPQLLTQLSQHPQFRQMMQVYAQQMKAGNAATGGRNDRT